MPTVSNRVRALEQQLPRHGEGDCPRPLITAIIDPGQPEPPPEEQGTCPACGGTHVLVLETVVVEPGDVPPA